MAVDTENEPLSSTLTGNTKPFSISMLIQSYGSDLSEPRRFLAEGGRSPPFAVDFRAVPSPALRIFAPQNENSVTDK